MRKKNPKNKNVYVIELDITLLPTGKMRDVFEKANPNRDLGKPCVYVGRTGLSPEERFAKHKNGLKNGKGYVTRFGVKLLPGLYRHENPLSWDEVQKREVQLAEELREKGYGVWQK